jgi:hypothetical protein
MLGGDDITQDDLIIHKLLGQDIRKYRSLFPHVSAAIKSSNNDDKLRSKGDTIKYIYTNSQHKNPLCRVASIDSRWLFLKKVVVFHYRGNDDYSECLPITYISILPSLDQ